MSKVLIIPDVHLKPWIFEKASAIFDRDNYDLAVILGDLVDDWGQERNLRLYNDTFDAAIAFVNKHPDTLWCYGNHDVSYLWEAMESGYSYYARQTVVKRIDDLKNAMKPENHAFIHRIDDVLFSHAGLMESFVLRWFDSTDHDIDTMLNKINTMGEEELWQDDSPLWARPQYGIFTPYPSNMKQVVGHTPVHRPMVYNNIMTIDNFSTYRDGTPIGDQRFVWVDTETDEFTFHYVK